MIEKKFVEAKKQELEVKEFIKNIFGKGKISEVKIERTPIGEKIVITTTRKGVVLGQLGESMQTIMNNLKKKFGLENPQIEIQEIDAEFDPQTIADRIALALERFGPLAFKLIAYRELEKLAKAGALGAEIRLSGKLPSERAKSWLFKFGYLKKTGETRYIVKSARAVAETKPGVVGIKVALVPKGTKIPDKIEIKQELKKIREKIEELKKEENGDNKK
ncbi:MAG: 30S ribosomal protein S3 [Candidatus Pacearchaeota archaeon]|nr:30S ribosomal protein S3 [Candidatus Pacearchaeota archaeon]